MPKKISFDQAMGMRKSAAKHAGGAGTRKYNATKKRMTWSEEQDAKKLRSRFMRAENAAKEKATREWLNQESIKRFGGAKGVDRIYKPGSRYGPGTVEGMWTVKMEDGMTGWIHKETLQFWSVNDTENILYKLDRMAVKNGIDRSYDYDLMWQYYSMNPNERAELSKWLSEQDWEQIWGNMYEGSQTTTRKRNKYAEIQQKMAEIKR